MSVFDPASTITCQHGSGDPTHAVIWLHGLGASANDFPGVLPYLNLDQQRCIRFVFPQAPERPITINGGYIMPGWYDIKGSDLKDKEDLPGMQSSESILNTLISEQIALGIHSENIIIAGFSQGGAVAYYTGLRTTHKLAGIMALSTYLSFEKPSITERNDINLATPILAMHGNADTVVPIDIGKASCKALTKMGYSVKWQAYDMEHSVIPEQLADIGMWMNKVLK